MASIVYNSMKRHALEGTFNLRTASAVKMILLKNTATTPDNPDHDFVNDISADEFDDTNYTPGFNGAGRKALAGRTGNTNLTDDRAELDFDNIIWTSLGGTQTAVFANMIREVTNDTLSDLITAHDIANTGTNGTDFTLTVGATGGVHIT